VTAVAHEAVNKGVGGEVGVIEVASWVDSGLSSVAEGAGVRRESEGDGKNEDGTQGTVMC
jgi:hypothetical protein